MIALDTSALLRYLTGDAPTAARAVESLLAGSERVGISTAVLVETVHILRGGTSPRTNPDVADTLIRLLAHENIALTDLDARLASAAIAGVRHLSPRHLVDALISAAAYQAGASTLVTADRKFASKLVAVRHLP